MPRPSLPPRAHGRVSVTHAAEAQWAAMAPRGKWCAVVRFHDPVEGLTQIRRWGSTEDEARAAVLAVCAERAARAVPEPPPFETLGDATAWWWAEVRPGLGWSEATERGYGFARQHLDERLGALRLPIDREGAEAGLPAGRTGQIARRLLSFILRLPGVG